MSRRKSVSAVVLTILVAGGLATGAPPASAAPSRTAVSSEVTPMGGGPIPMPGPLPLPLPLPIPKPIPIPIPIPIPLPPAPLPPTPLPPTPLPPILPPIIVEPIPPVLPPIVVDPTPTPPKPTPPTPPPVPPKPVPPPGPQSTLTVTRVGPGAGVVTGGPINCGGTCSADVGQGSVITLAATADTNNVFVGWRGACSGDSPTCKVTLNDDKRVIAEFRLIKDRVVVTTNGKGNVATPSPGIDCGSKCAADFVRGSTISLTAVPAPDSFFGGWSGVCNGTTATCIVPINGVAKVTASFVKAKLKLKRAAFEINWNLSRIDGKLALAGSVTGPASLKVALSGRALDKPTQYDVQFPTPGSFRHALPLPAGLFPGRYRLDVSGTVGGIALKLRKVIILRAPPSGFVSAASISTTQAGQAIEALSANETEMWARFTFAARPKAICVVKRKAGKKAKTCRSPQITVSWMKPDGSLAVPPQAFGRGTNLAAGISATPPIDAGTWTVTLRVGATAVYELKFVVNS